MRRCRARELLSLKGCDASSVVTLIAQAEGYGLYLAASLALMRLLARVHTLVNCESRSLNKLFPTTREIADVWPDTTVDAF
jgi:hypothetical protein